MSWGLQMTDLDIEKHEERAHELAYAKTIRRLVLGVVALVMGAITWNNTLDFVGDKNVEFWRGEATACKEMLGEDKS